VGAALAAIVFGKSIAAKAAPTVFITALREKVTKVVTFLS
jgi:hypothetical protein